MGIVCNRASNRQEKKRMIHRRRHLLRNKTTIAQVITKSGARLLNHSLELEETAYAIFLPFFCSILVNQKNVLFCSRLLSINIVFIQGHMKQTNKNY